MKSTAAVALAAVLAVAACSSAAAPTPQIVYVTPPPSMARFTAPTPDPTPAATLVPASPVSSPTPDRDATAARFTVVDTAYVKAAMALVAKTLGTSRSFASYAQAHSYYSTEVRNLQRYDTNLRAMTFPADVIPDVRLLLQRIADLGILMKDLAGSDSESRWSQLTEEVHTATSAVEAARVMVGEDLGLSFSDAVAAEPASTPRPGVAPQPASTPRPYVAPGWTLPPPLFPPVTVPSLAPVATLRPLPSLPPLVAPPIPTLRPLPDPGSYESSTP